MKKLEIELRFTSDSLSIVNEASVIEMCNSLFKEGYLDGTISEQFEWKSTVSNNRFFGAVVGTITLFLAESGYRFSDKLSGLYYLMENLPSESGFGLSDKWVDIGYGPSGNVVSRKAIPMSKIGRKQLNELTFDLTKFLNDMGYDVPDTDEYKMSKKLG